MTESMFKFDRQFSAEDAKITHRELSFSGFFQIETLTLQHALFNGGEIHPIKRELFVRGAATCMLPYDPEADKVVLCEQFRVGALGGKASPWLLELVAGINDHGESPEQVARREAEEEAGLQVEKFAMICEYYPSPGGSNEWITLLCGKVDSQGAEGIYGLQHEGEDIRVHVLDREDAFALLAAGKINNAAGIIGLQWLQMNYAELQEKWS